MLKKICSFLFFLILTCSINAQGQDYSGSYENDLWIGPGSMHYQYGVSFDFSFDNPNCTIENFEWSSLSAIPFDQDVTVHFIQGNYSYNSNTFSIVMAVDDGGPQKLVSTDLSLSEIANNAGLGPGICH